MQYIIHIFLNLSRSFCTFLDVKKPLKYLINWLDKSNFMCIIFCRKLKEGEMSVQSILKPVPPKRHAVGIGFKSVLQSLRMVLWPLFMTAPALILYHICYKNGWHSTRSADEPIINAILPGLFGLHAFIAGVLLVFREGSDLLQLKAYAKKPEEPGNKEKFIQLAENQLPAPVKYVLFVSATIIILWTISLSYGSYWSGLASVLSVTYILSLIWEVIADFDDPTNGIWVIRGVPDDWVSEIKIKRRLSDRILDGILAD